MPGFSTKLWSKHSCVQRSHSPETLHAGIDSEALVGQAGSLRPIGNRPAARLRQSPGRTGAVLCSGRACPAFGPGGAQVSGPRDAPAGTVFRSCERASDVSPRVGTLHARVHAPLKTN